MRQEWSSIAKRMQHWCYATDDEAYKVFGDLFSPIIKDIHPRFDYRYSYSYEALSSDLIEKHIFDLRSSIDKVVDFKIQIARNFKDTPFAPLMTRESKLQVERKVVEVLGDLYGSYHQLPKLSEENVEWLKERVGIDPHHKTAEHDAGGLNDDFPVGRGIFIQDQKDFVVLVNFEDHIKIIVLRDDLSDKGHLDTLQLGFARAIKLLQTFEKIGFATDPYLGYLTVSPQNLGTAMQLEAKMKFPSDRSIDKNLKNLLTEDKKMSYEQTQFSEHILKTTQTLCQNLNEVAQISEFIISLDQIANKVN